jgi:iron complex transport system substrate-binding protein
MPPQRVVSLIASATETVAALGCLDRLVGRSHECDYPPSVRELPVCTGAKLDVHASGAEIDRQVKSLLAEAVSIYSIDTRLLNELQPDVILTQSQCEVCAVSLREVEQAVCSVVGSRPHIVAVEPNGLADIWTSFRQVAEALQVASRGDELIARCQARLEALFDRSRKTAATPTVACIEWIEPLMAAGNWVPELVEIAGGINLFGEPGKHSPWMTWEALVARDPEAIVVMPCGWDIARARSEMHPLTARPEWRNLRAMQSGRVAITDGNQFFNRPGPRVVESAEILAEILHPDDFDFGHRDVAWETCTAGL